MVNDLFIACGKSARTNDMPRVRVKICGVTMPADAVLAADLGADAIGLNFYPQSPRYVDDVAATAILKELPPFVQTVGVFVNESGERMRDRAWQLGKIHALQVHNSRVEQWLPYPYSLILAEGVRDAETFARLKRVLELYRLLGLPDALLIDTKLPGEYQTTGQTAPWDLLAGFQPGVPLILAGGLTPENVAEAIRRVRPYAVDVAGGVESSPGKKDPEKLKRFIEAVHGAI